ncbi:GNAT family N-acetyltransferase [Kitasatospora sp. NPDC057692]|uniref:GNAT family N-acetyltransferase n=1 Tax=Kitasatospora sp. NPDC057692 TaxID=3346215 RepID=UPI0036BD0768
MGVEWWEMLPESGPGAVLEVVRRCLAVDGGLPVAGEPSFVGRRYDGPGTVRIGAYEDGRLVACGAARPYAGYWSLVGAVDPDFRGRGLGGELLDRLMTAAETVVQVETEALTPAAEELFRSRGLRQEFAEDVFRLGPETPLPAVAWPAGVGIEEWPEDCWEEGAADAFHEAYRHSFADRPGFPGWTRAEWATWLIDDGFRPGASLLARDSDGVPVGFVVCAEGFLVQVGAVPAWRRRGLGRALAVAALERLRAAGDAEVFLDVNVNNPASAALFRSLGLTRVARRARFGRP